MCELQLRLIGSIFRGVLLRYRSCFLAAQRAEGYGLKLCALLALTATGCFAQSITFVQGGKTGYKELKVVSCTGETNTASHLLLAAVYAASNTVTVGVSDTMGNAWTALPADISANGQIKLFYAIAKSTASNIISATQTSSAGSFGLFCSEWSGNAISGVVDVQTAANATSQTASMSSGNLATTGSSDLLYCVFADKNNGAMKAGSGFTQDEIDTGFGALSEYKKSLTAGSYSCNATDTAPSTYWLAYAAAFKASGSSSNSSPTVTAISPASATTAGGTAVTITGTGFVSGATVTLGGTAATKVTVVSSTTITATTPAHAAGAVNVVVSDSNGSGTLTNGFTYTASVAPINFVQVAAATPQVPETTVTVAYSLPQTVGDLNVVVVGWNDTTATVQSVKDSAGNSYSLAIGPTSGTALRQSLYYAKNIVGGSNEVTVAFSPAAVFPDIRILEYSGLDPSSPLDVSAGASGNSTAASSGAVTTTAANELIFGADTVFTGNKTPGTGFNTRIITTPDGNIAEDRTVSATGSYSAGATLNPSGPWVMQMATFKAAIGTGTVAPTITSVSPSSGTTAGGTAVTITGTGFVSGAAVTFGSVVASNVTVVSSTSITATTPAHATGAVNVVVTDSNGSGTLANGFTYSNPALTVTAISPVSGTTAGGITVTITGTGFVSGATVTLGSTAASNVTVVSSTSIMATTPAVPAGVASVVVTNPGGQSGTLTNGFTYLNLVPAATAISPASGSTNGGAVVTITGTNFVSGMIVTFGGIEAAETTVVNSTSITATTPIHAAGAVSVAVTNLDAQNATLANAFTYTAGVAPINFVQVAAATPQVPETTVTVAYSLPQTVGDLNVVVVGWNDTTATVQSVKDNVGNSYSLAIGPTSGAALRQSLYYAKNIVGGSNEVTVVFSPAADFPDIRILEYSGLDPSSPLDDSAGASGNSTAAITGAVSTTAANELIFGADTVFTGNKTPGTGFNTRIITTPDGNIAEDRTVSVTGSYSASATLNPSGPWVMQMATFKAGIGVGALPPTITSVFPGSGSTNGGTVATITGINFAAGTSVTFGGVAATDVVVANSTTITAVTPPGNAGAVTVAVQENSASAFLANGFTYASNDILATGPLRVSSTNPRYFADGTGQAVYLTGAHTWQDNVDGWGIPNDCPVPPVFDWSSYLAYVGAHQYDWIRLWTWELPTSLSEAVTAGTVEPECHLPVPYLRTGPGNATDGLPKFDLTQFDQSYFDRLRQRVIEAGQQGVYVSVMLFDGYGLHSDRLATDGYWFTGTNNINGVDDGYVSGISGTNSQSLQFPAITAFQDAYVRKVIDSVNDLDNVMYEVANEAGGSYSTDWQLHMIELVHQYEAGLPKQHPVGFTCQYPNSPADSTYFSSNADWVAGCSAGYSWTITGTPGGNVTELSTGNKVVIDDTDHAWPWMEIQAATLADPNAMRKWAWENFTRGANTAFMDPYLVVWPVRNAPSGTTLDPQWNVLRTALSQTAAYAKRIDLGLAAPQNTSAACSTLYCLTSEKQYLIYSPTGGAITVQLAVADTYSYEWFNPATNAVIQTGTVTIAASGSQTFTPPFTGPDAVLLLLGN
jgi:hypothetical protein